MSVNRFACVGLLLVLAASPHLHAAENARAEIRPMANLVVQNIPSIPASIAADVNRYTEFRAANLADWAPDAREMLITTRFGNTAQVHRVKMPMGARTQLTFFNEPIGQTVYEPQAGKYFIFTKDVGGNEFTQLYRYDFADGRTTLLTDGGRSQNGGIEWNTHKDRIAYGSTRRNGTDRDIHCMDPLDPKTDKLLLQVSGGGWAVSDWSPDDEQLLLTEMISGTETRLWLLNLASGEKKLLTPATGEGASYVHARFDKSGTALYLASDQESEFQRLVRMDLASGKLTPLVDSMPWEVEAMEPSPDRDRIAFTVNEAGVSRLYLFDIPSGKSTPIAGIDAAVITDLTWQRSGKELAFSVASARSPADVYSCDVQTRAITRWTESEMGGLVASELVAPKLVKWPSFDGREITGFLYQPPSRFAGKRPVLVQIHGGPESQARPTFLGRNNYYLNELGVAILFPNVRGSAGYGKSFMKLDNGAHREDSVKDIGALLDWIAAEPSLDPTRIMIAGGSYGGYMTLATAFHYNERIRCALDVVGISNFNTFLKNTESYRRDLRRAEYGDERDAAMHDFFEKTAPLNNAEKITRPLFVVQGGNDPRVPHTEAEQMVKRISQNGTPVWFLMATDEGHGFRKKENADFQFYATVLFMQRYLLNQPGQ